MFDKPTVIVIGAGAGVEIDMPLGSTLSSTIADKTFIRHKDFGPELVSGDYAIVAAMKQITKDRGADYNQWRAEACTIREGIHHSRSIDAFLNTHKGSEGIKVVGKLAIVQSILEAEHDSAMKWSDDGWKDAKKVGGSWFSDLFYIMQDGVGRSDNLQDIFKNVSFITFNYDRCLEHYLYHSIVELYQVHEQQAAAVMDGLHIIHPYGQVGSLPWMLKARAKRKVQFGEKGNRAIAELSSEIRTFFEQIEDQALLDAVQAMLNGAERIVFLGYHFHKQNMDLLTVKNESGTVRPVVFATTFGRSGPEQNMITERVSKFTGVNRPPKSIELLGLGCKDLFKNYATTWM